MTGVLLSLLAVILAGLGARDQAAVAALAERQGPRPGLLVVAIAVSFLTAGLAAWAGSTIAPMMVAKARLVLAAMALGMGGAELLIVTPGRKPEEPTLSLGAVAIVLVAHQLTDGARFLVFAIAVATAALIPAGVGGAVGGAAMLTAAWLAPGQFAGKHLRTARRAIGGVFLLLALVLAWNALG